MRIISKDSRVYTMSERHAPAARVASGERLAFETCDCFSDQIQRVDTPFEGLDWARVNPATGPVFIEGAQPGDTLAVHIERIELAEQAVMVTAPGLGVVGDRIHAPEVQVFAIRDGAVEIAGRVRVALQPMIGVIGTAPKGAPIACGVPDAHGGNMDCKVIGAGATLFLPVEVPGALLALGDLHAAMGDGEVSVCGLEVAGRVELRVQLIKGRSLALPALRNDTHFYTIASAVLLDDAAKLATNHMADFLVAHAGLTLVQAINLMSACGNLQICQVVDPQKTCRFELSRSIFEQLKLSHELLWQ